MFDGDGVTFIETQIGTIKKTRNLNAIAGATWALCGTIHGVGFFTEPNLVNGIFMGLSIAAVAYHVHETKKRNAEIKEIETAYNDYKRLVKTFDGFEKHSY